MSLPFVGPSYNLRSRSADVQRTVGMYPVPIEPGNTKAGYVFKDVPGKSLWATLGGEARGGLALNGRAFAVFDETLYELYSDGTNTVRGTIGSASGFVGMAANTTQLAIGDDSSLYVLTLATNVLTTIASYPGAGRLEYLNQYILFRNRNSQQFGWTTLGDASVLDPLNFASAESSPDNLIGIIVDHQEALLFGAKSTEDWLNVTTSDIFAKNSGAAIEEGCASEWTLCKMDGSVFWLASSDRGQGAVNRLQGYQPVRISTQAIEQKLAGLDLSAAYAYTYESDKSTFYILNVPGLDTTLCYDVFSQSWHERARLVNGQYQPDRGKFHLYAFGKHLIGADDGNLYALDPELHTDAGEVMVRDRVLPDQAVPSQARVPYNTFRLDCDRGTGATVQMRFSNNGGATWGAWRSRSAGEIGKYETRVKWGRCGSGKDRVWQVRCTDDAPFNPTSATVT